MYSLFINGRFYDRAWVGPSPDQLAEWLLDRVHTGAFEKRARAMFRISGVEHHFRLSIWAGCRSVKPIPMQPKL